MYKTYAIPKRIKATAINTVQIVFPNKWTGLKQMYNPEANKIKKASPKVINVIYFGKHPTIARYNNPTRKPIKRENFTTS